MGDDCGSQRTKWGGATYACPLTLTTVWWTQLMLFSLAITAGSQCHFAFTWEGCQWTFQVLPQGYLHSPTICHRLVTEDWVKWKRPASMKLLCWCCVYCKGYVLWRRFKTVYYKSSVLCVSSDLKNVIMWVTCEQHKIPSLRGGPDACGGFCR